MILLIPDDANQHIIIERSSCKLQMILHWVLRGAPKIFFLDNLWSVGRFSQLTASHMPTQTLDLDLMSELAHD